jgi:hypothetical protein
MLHGEGETCSETEAAIFGGDSHAVAFGHLGDQLSAPGGQFRNPA